MSRENIANFLEKFENLTKKPTKFLSVQDDICEDVKQLIKSMYDFTKLEEKGATNGSEALPELIVEDFDEEQIWQEIELQNCAQWDSLIRSVSSCVSSQNNLNFPVDRPQSAASNRTSEDELPSESDSHKQHEDQPIEQIKKKIDKTVSNKKQGKSSVVDDDFFRLDEMEKFLEQEDKKEMLQFKKKNKVNDSDDDSIDLFQESEAEESDQENEDIYNMKYEDFFDSAAEQNASRKHENHSDSEYEDAIADEQDIDEEKEGAEEAAVSKKSVRFNIDDSESDDDSVDQTVEAVNLTNKGSEETKLTKHELRQQRLKEKIHKLEQKNLAEKPWQLKGEVDALTRPQNSLLEEVVDFDLTTRPAPVITEETTLKLEDIIRQRIKDKVWDDVERKAKPVPETHEFKKSVVLDQEKSKMSLAQVYEQEYLKQKRSMTGDEDTHENEPEEHKKIKKAMSSLFAKLDALSNYHYTPKPAQAEVKIVSNIPAISMEEVAPVATSDAALLAPEEVKGKRKGDLMSKSERTVTDKKRERRKKKNLQREKQKEKNKKENLLTKLNPGLGNKYSKEKASKMLDKVSKDFHNTDKMTQLNDVKALKSSKAFFTQLNDDISSTVKSKNKKELMPAKKYKL